MRFQEPTPVDKLIITVTCDSTMSYPRNPNNPTPRGMQAVADDYIRSVNAGASICGSPRPSASTRASAFGRRWTQGA